MMGKRGNRDNRGREPKKPKKTKEAPTPPARRYSEWTPAKPANPGTPTGGSLQAPPGYFDELGRGKLDAQNTCTLGLERAVLAAGCPIYAGLFRKRFRHGADRSRGHRTCQRHDRRA